MISFRLLLKYNKYLILMEEPMNTFSLFLLFSSLLTVTASNAMRLPSETRPFPTAIHHAMDSNDIGVFQTILEDYDNLRNRIRANWGEHIVRKAITLNKPMFIKHIVDVYNYDINSYKDSVHDRSALNEALDRNKDAVVAYLLELQSPAVRPAVRPVDDYMNEEDAAELLRALALSEEAQPAPVARHPIRDDYMNEEDAAELLRALALSEEAQPVPVVRHPIRLAAETRSFPLAIYDSMATNDIHAFQTTLENYNNVRDHIHATWGEHIVRRAIMLNKPMFIKHIIDVYNYDINTYKEGIDNLSALDTALELNQEAVVNYLLELQSPSVRPAVRPANDYMDDEEAEELLRALDLSQEKQPIIESDKCCICLENIEDLSKTSQIYKTTCCNHFICKNDYDIHRRYQDRCPLCRRSEYSTPAFGIVPATVARPTAPILPTVDRADTCGICAYEAKDCDAHQIYKTKCCKHFICLDDAQELQRRAAETYRQLQDPVQRRIMSERPDFTGWPDQTTPHAKCPYCRHEKLEIEKAMIR
jgi:hypothetical protein